MPRPDSPFRQPLQLVEHSSSFEIRAANGQHLAFVYFEDEPIRRDLLKHLTKEDAPICRRGAPHARAARRIGAAARRGRATGMS
jgi:hypothetical protein